MTTEHREEIGIALTLLQLCGTQPRVVRHDNDSDSSASDEKHELCCVDSCDRKAANRHKRSLKLPVQFKPNYESMGMINICNFHYFRDLHAYHKKRKYEWLVTDTLLYDGKSI